MQTYSSSSQPTVLRGAAKHVLLLLALAVASVLTLALVSSAQASGGFYYGQWWVTLAFPQNEPVAELTTQVWYKPVNGTAVLVNAETEELECTTFGKLQINNELATFTGQEYISCEQPDMVQKFLDVSNGALVLSDHNVVTRTPFVDGQLAVAPSAPVGTTLPTFYHPSIQHGVARLAAGNARQTFQVDGAASNSTAYAQTAPNLLRAEFKSMPAGHYRPEFTANGSTTLGSPANIGSGLEVNLAETTIYFGYSPESNSYFRGNIKTLTADPGAFGRD